MPRAADLIKDPAASPGCIAMACRPDEDAVTRGPIRAASSATPAKGGEEPWLSTPRSDLAVKIA